MRCAPPYPVEFVGASDLLDRLRLVLSPEELALTRAADAIADVGQERLIAILEPGATARDLVDAVRAAMLDAILERHPDMPFHIHVGTGLGSGAKGAGHSEWATWNGETRVESGQLLETVISVWLWGYWGNVERAVYVGEPRPRSGTRSRSWSRRMRLPSPPPGPGSP